MQDAIKVERLGKKFYRYHQDRPRAFVEMFLRGFRQIRPKQIFWGLQDVSFRVAPGKILGVIGQNGAGKSTLLRLIGGVGRPDEGSVRLHGHVGGFLDLKAGLRADLTGRENVYISGVIAGLTRREVDARFEDIVHFAEIGEFIDSPLRTYSTGMEMRLAFAVAAHTNPDILLIDEVLAVGDEAFRRKCYKRIEAFRENGCTIVIVSHQMNQIKQLCDEVIWLHNGRLAAIGDPELVVSQYITEMRMKKQQHLRQMVFGQREAIASLAQKARFGTEEVVITNVSLLNRQGQLVTEISAGDALRIALDYDSPQPVESPIFNVVISREGAVCCTLNTLAADLSLPSLQGRGQIRLDIERLDLVDGQYTIDVAVYKEDWAYAYDYHRQMYAVSVNG